MDPTFELTYREYGAHPEPDEFAMLLSIGCSPEEAAMILDADILDFESWTEMYGEEVTAQDQYSTLEPI